MSVDLEQRRRFYAEEIAAVADLRMPELVEAFARVPRERFLGDGPWQIPVLEADFRGHRYRQTPDADARHVYHNVAVAIDVSRDLNNGQPATLATWLDWMMLKRNLSAVHLGCGTGYYTAIMAETVGPGGQVTAIEADAALAARAAANLAPWPNVTVLHGDGVKMDGPADVIFINAGVTHALDSWLDALADGGHMLLPVGFTFGPGTLTKGGAVRLERHGDRYSARWLSMLMIYACSVARDAEANQKIGRALQTGTWMKVRSLRRDPHDEDATCCLHTTGSCLSTREA